MREAPVGGVEVAGVDGLEGEQGGGAVDVALDDVAAERRACGCGEFEVDDGAGLEAGERGAGDGLGGEIGGEVRWDGGGLMSSAVRQTPLTAMESPVRSVR